MTTATRPLNRQEATFYFLFAALLLCGVVLAAVLFWAVAATSSPPLTRLGTVDDFPPRSKPYYVALEEGRVWVVNLNGRLLALNADYSSDSDRFSCKEMVVWVPTNSRFEGPCSGDKFALDGRWIKTYSTEPHGLQQFPVAVRDGAVWVDFSRPIEGDTIPSVVYTPRP